MPASRSARAMIFAPRSWPSRPGLAITTRIFRAIAGSLDLDGSGYVQCRQVRLTHLAAGTSFDPPADPLVEALARLVIERTMTGIGVEHRDVLLRGVDHVPDVTADADVAEAVARCGRATSHRARPRRFSAPTRPRANGRRASRGRA